MAAQWMPVSPSLSATDDDAVSIHSSLSSATTGSASTTGTAKYVAPNLRKKRAQLQYELETVKYENEIAAERAVAAKHQGPRLPMFNLPYCLNKDQLSFITARFPRTTFRCKSDVMHDHPLAHTETMIATTKAMYMVPAGHEIIDLFGSPSKCSEFNASQARSNNPKHMVAYCATMTEKDYLRALKWGSERAPDGTLRYVRSHTGDVLADVDPHRGGVDPAFGVTDTTKLTYFCRNTLYYLSDYQIASLLRPTGSRMLALVHRHQGASGNMFGGEMTFAKIGDTVEQVNVLTGERYVHRDLSWLWDSKTKVSRTEAGSFVWTFHMVSPETWIVELTGCPSTLDERVVNRARSVGVHAAFNEDHAASLAPTRFPHPALATLPGADVVLVGGIPVVSFRHGRLPPMRLTCPELYEFLRIAQAGKLRDGERLLDLFSLARSHVANGSEFPGKKNFKVSADDLPGHVVLAFVSGLETETQLFGSLEAFRVISKTHSSLLAGNAIINANPMEEPQVAIRSTLSVLKRANEVRRSKDTFSAILEAME